MDKKTRFKITLDNEIADLLTKMAKERHQTKSVFIANLVLDQESGAGQQPVMTDEQFHQLSGTLQVINNQLRKLGTEANNKDLRKVLVSVEEKVSKLEEKVTKLVYY